MLTIAGLENGQNVLVDGSMRNASWYLNYISDLRHQFPYLKVGGQTRPDQTAATSVVTRLLFSPTSPCHLYS